jgi:hypothetical protein
MIDDLNLAIAIHERRNTSEIVVSRKVLIQVLNHLSAERVHGAAKLNLKQGSTRYPFLHYVCWQGIRFIHMSKDRLTVGLCGDMALSRF